MNTLVTGSNSGFGKLIVATLLAKGYTVAASMRDLGGRNKDSAAALRKTGAMVVEMDVARDESVVEGVAAALATLGHIDAVINNAGLGVLGVQETFTVEDFRKIFEVNVFGVQRVNRAVLPDMRRRGRGVLIHISSLLGRVTLPFYGPYTASKWAVEALAENYRAELSGFGVDSLIVEPGGFATEFISNLQRPSDTQRVAGYGAFADAPEVSLRAFEVALARHEQQRPQDVADAVARLLETPPGQRPFRTVVDKLGMGAAVQPYNEQSARITAELYRTLGMEKMLTLKTL